MKHLDNHVVVCIRCAEVISATSSKAFVRTFAGIPRGAAICFKLLVHSLDLVVFICVYFVFFSYCIYAVSYTHLTLPTILRV